MKHIKIKKDVNNLVAKANILIEAKDNLSGNSRKMLAMIISMIRHDDKEFMQYALNRKDYLNLIQSKSNNDKFFKDTARELMMNPFDLNGIMYNWCSKVDTKTIEGSVVFEVHRDLKPYLLNLKEEGNFTQYKIVNILSLRGEYNQKLYEYLIMRMNKKKKYRKDEKINIEIDELRKILNIPISYKYGDIKKNILNKSVIQFADKTDIKISYVEVKQGRKVVSIDITVLSNNKGSNDYLASLKTFIAFLRKEMVNVTLIEFDDRGKKIELAVSEKGILYNKREVNNDINPKNALDLWDNLYNIALKGKLKCL